MPSSTPRHRLPAALIFLVCAAVYFLTRSPALDEWDSVQFALGVGDFDLSRHQPHPPGYPLYVASGWLAHRLLPLDVPNALQLVSALGGGLFVAGWFVLIARRFGRFTAGVCAGALATLLITWMTATKVLTDPAGAGWLALTLVFADASRRDDTTGDRSLAATAAAGAVAVGMRPQNAGVVLLIVGLTVLAVRRPSMRRRWVIGLGVFAAVALLWLLPTVYLQAHTPGADGNWLTYPRQLFAQWRWRLDQPRAFVGASDADLGKSVWLYRADHHGLMLLTRGFGFGLDSARGWLGIGVLAAGWTFYALAGRVRWSVAGEVDPRAFWRQHLPWAGLYYLTIFCFLPGDQRYYLPIFPLLILPAVLGWQSLRLPGREPGARWQAILVPAVTLAATLPFVGPNHAEAAPPVRMIRWLQAQHPPGTRARVWLILKDSLRHAQWYARDFHIENAADIPATLDPPPIDAAYTDDPAYAAAHGFRRVETFRRSPLIYRKHNAVELYRYETERP